MACLSGHTARGMSEREKAHTGTCRAEKATYLDRTLRPIPLRQRVPRHFSEPKTGDYKFSVEVNGDVLSIVGLDNTVLPGVSLKKIIEFPYSEAEHFMQKWDAESMSPEEQDSLLAKLRQMQIERRGNDA